MFLLGSFFGTLWASWTSWKSISFAKLGKFSFIICSNKFSILFSLWYPYNLDVKTFKVVPEVPKPLIIFLNSCFFILFWLNVYFLLLFLIIDLGCSFLSLTVGSLYILLYFTLHSLHSFLYFASILNHFCEHPDHQFLNSASDRLAISSTLCFFLEF